MLCDYAHIIQIPPRTLTIIELFGDFYELEGYY